MNEQTAAKPDQGGRFAPVGTTEGSGEEHEGQERLFVFSI
jgi:hypothetical protein